MAIHDGPTATSSATAVGPPRPVTFDSGRRRSSRAAAGRPTRRTVHPGPPGVAHPGEFDRPNPDGLSRSGPLISTGGTRKAIALRLARSADHTGPPSAMLTLRHRPPEGARRGAGAPSAGPTSRTPTGMAPKWGREEIVPVRPTPEAGGRIAKKAAFVLAGSAPTPDRTISIRWPAAGPPPANSPTRRCLAAPGTDTKGETAADHRRPELKGASMSTTHPHRTLPAPPARLHRAAPGPTPRPTTRTPPSEPLVRRASRPIASAPGAIPRAPALTRPSPRPARRFDMAARSTPARAAPPTTSAKAHPPRDPMRSEPDSHPHPPIHPNPPPHPSRGVRGVAPRADITRDRGKPLGRGRSMTSQIAWAYVVSNHGPLPCEGSALPLSYTPLRVVGPPYTAPIRVDAGGSRRTDTPMSAVPSGGWTGSGSPRLAKVENHPDGEGSKWNGLGRLA